MNRFYILDVFAERKYAGNQLAVFRAAENIPGAEMQALAREINYSETTFILSDEPRDGGWDVRIFTPKEEIPFAGHPTLGTAHVIGREILPGRVERIVLNLPVGRIPVALSPDGYGWMKQLPPAFGPRHDPAALARILGLDLADLDERYPVEEVSTGLPFFIVPLRGIAALQRARVDRDRYFDLVSHTAAKGILIFCSQTHEPGNDLSVRVFVDYLGVPEDPATGSGNGCLAGYLARYRYLGTERIDLRVEQGYEIGRPSLLLLRAGPGEGGIDVSVGGKSIVVARGELATGQVARPIHRTRRHPMPDTQMTTYLAQLRDLQDEILAELERLDRPALKYETDSPRWNTVRRVLLRFGDHLREHTTQLVAARDALGCTQTMPQRILARSMEAYGALLGALVGLDDCDLDREPEPGEWTTRQALEHMIATQKGYLDTVRRALQEARPVEKD